MNIQTQEQAKSAVSALRRELKAVGNVSAGALSHTQCLELLAKTLGYANWNTWKASLGDSTSEAQAPGEALPAKATAQPAPRFMPSNNEGQYDFVKQGEEGQLYSGSFIVIQGTLDNVPGIATISSVTRDATGQHQVESAGETDVIWDDQETVTEDGQVVYVDDDGENVLCDKTMLLPESFDGDVEELPVRQAIVEDFDLYLGVEKLTGDALESAISQAEQDSGFELTPQERKALKKLRSPKTMRSTLRQI